MSQASLTLASLPHDILNHLEQYITAILEMSNWSSQQQPFITHIKNTYNQLNDLIAPCPKNAHALADIIPKLGDQYLQPQVALFGYAKMLRDMPDAFQSAPLNDMQNTYLKEIETVGQLLHEQTQQFINGSMKRRISARKEASISLHIENLIEEQVLIYQYWLRDKPIKLSLTPYIQTTPQVTIQRYHFRAFLDHMVYTLAQELIEFGQIRISIHSNSDKITIGIFCSGVQFTEAEKITLFEHQGRAIYWQYLQSIKANPRFLIQGGVGATFEWDILIGKNDP